jgi:hypothetical protein
MRQMTLPENQGIIEDNGESSDCVIIEATINELAVRRVGMVCGHAGNSCFTGINMDNPSNGSHVVRGWYNPAENTMWGNIFIQCDSKATANKISKSAERHGGSLRPEDKGSRSPLPGFWEFEIE